ncbi:gamma-glutamyltranspeptidase [Ascobolus immersus RN42]|uniref:Glutathione hydrolase n=1 Tax=Ascobolus immersus RN42 TaxID=1160509 RepID=A0A3N4HYN8_ASCIM|nr:gamma-glutamyltranspeptidase [Ascobolus immersus RN42]
MRRRLILGLGIIGFSLCAHASYQVVNRPAAERPPGTGEHYYHWNIADGKEPHDLSIEVQNGAVSSDVDLCSQIGVEILKKGGNAVDGAIATAVCLGTVNGFASGIGGGGFMVYRGADGESKSFNFREAAPKAAFREMYHGEPLLAQVGGLAFGVPGEVDGFWKAHKLYGNLPWKDLWLPSIALAEKGFVIQPELGRQIKKQEEFFLENLEDWKFLESPYEAGRVIREGELLRRPVLAKTLRKIAEDNGVEEFYRGSIAESLSSYAQKHGGIVTKDDFAQYKTIVTEPLTSTFLGKEIVTCPPPCSGAVLIEALHIAEISHLSNASNPVESHRVVEMMKWMSAGRTELGDPTDTDVDNMDRVAELQSKEYARAVYQNISDDRTYDWKHYNPSYEANDPKGTSHLSVLDKDGNAVALTTTVNLYWGAKLHDPNTGIVLNSEMDDFSIPGRSNAYDLKPSIYNFIKPFKRPLSSTAPTIIVEDGKASLIIGASGGSRIVTSVFQAIVKNVLWDLTLLDTLKSPRLHHQLIPEVATMEAGIPQAIIDGLEARGHTLVDVSGGSVIQAIRRYSDGRIVAVADWWRKGGVCYIPGTLGQSQY